MHEGFRRFWGACPTTPCASAPAFQTNTPQHENGNRTLDEGEESKIGERQKQHKNRTDQVLDLLQIPRQFRLPKHKRDAKEIRVDQQHQQKQEMRKQNMITDLEILLLHFIRALQQEFVFGERLVCGLLCGCQVFLANHPGMRIIQTNQNWQIQMLFEIWHNRLWHKRVTAVDDLRSSHAFKQSCRSFTICNRTVTWTRATRKQHAQQQNTDKHDRAHHDFDGFQVSVRGQLLVCDRRELRTGRCVVLLQMYNTTSNQRTTTKRTITQNQATHEQAHIRVRARPLAVERFALI